MTKSDATSFHLSLSGQRAPVDYDRATSHHGMVADKDVFVPMRGGVKIAVDDYRPQTRERLPLMHEQEEGAGRLDSDSARPSSRCRSAQRCRSIIPRIPTRCHMAEITIHNPPSLGKPLGQYSQITRVKASELLFIAGQVATDKEGKCVGLGDFDVQCAQVFANIETALVSQGATFANVVEFTTYLVHSQDIARFMTYRLREFPRMFANGRYPPNTLLIVDRLVQESFLIEVATVAAL